MFIPGYPYGSAAAYMVGADAFATYQSLTGGVIDPTTGLLTITPDQFANLKSLFFNIGGVRRRP